MSAVSDHEVELAETRQRAGLLWSYLETMRGFAIDAQGRTIVLGLSADETLEFLRLDPIVNSEAHGGEVCEHEAAEERYYALREKHDAARGADAVENLKFWNGIRSSQ